MWWILGFVVVMGSIVAWLGTGNGWVALMGGLVLAIGVVLLKASVIIVPERKAAVVVNRLAFRRRLRGPGMGTILPWGEYVRCYLDLEPKAAQITASDIHTQDQVPVTISSSLFYRLDPWSIDRAMHAQILDQLELVASAVLQRQVEQLLRVLVGQRTVSTLLQPENRVQLEDGLTRALPRHLSWLGIVLMGPVMLGGITLPEAIQAELNLAQQAQIRARAKAEVVKTLKDALGTQPGRAWESFMEAELVDAMARNGVPVVFPYSTEWPGRTFHDQTNGRT